MGRRGGPERAVLHAREALRVGGPGGAGRVPHAAAPLEREGEGGERERQQREEEEHPRGEGRGRRAAPAAGGGGGGGAPAVARHGNWDWRRRRTRGAQSLAVQDKHTRGELQVQSVGEEEERRGGLDGPEWAKY